MDGHEHEIGKQRPRADVSRPHERAFARYSGMYTQGENPTFPPSLRQLSIRPPTPSHPTPSDPDRLKWFVFDLTTTAATAAATVDGGTLFPPRTLPSFNVSRRMCGGVARSTC